MPVIIVDTSVCICSNIIYNGVVDDHRYKVRLADKIYMPGLGRFLIGITDIFLVITC